MDLTERTVDAVQLGRAIVATRAELGMKRGQLADLAQVSYPYLSELENGTKHGSTRKIGQIAAALGLTPSQLLARAEALARSAEPCTGPNGSRRVESTTSVPASAWSDPAAEGLPVLRPLGRTSERTEDVVVERVTRAVRAEIERWLDAELETAVRDQVRAVLGRGYDTR